MEAAFIDEVRGAIIRRSVEPAPLGIAPADRVQVEITLWPPLRPEIIGRVLLEASEASSSPVEGSLKVHWVHAEPELVLLSIDRLPSDVVRLDAWIDVLRKNVARMPPSIAAEIVVRVADTVSRCHDQGPWFGHPRVHGSLSPDVVLVDGKGRVSVIGTGLPVLDALLTARPGAEVELDRHRAPEQVRGEPATERTDVFALGALYYELLCGSGYRERLEGEQWVIASLERRPADLPGDLQSVRPALLALLRRALAPDPEDRFATVTAFRAAVVSDLLESTLPPAPSSAIAEHVAALHPAWRGPSVLSIDLGAPFVRPPRPEPKRAPVEKKTPVELPSWREGHRRAWFPRPQPAPVLDDPWTVEEIRAEDLLDTAKPGATGVIDLWIEELGGPRQATPVPPVQAAPPRRPLASLPSPLPFAEELGLRTGDLSADLERPRAPSRGPALAALVLSVVALGWLLRVLFLG